MPTLDRIALVLVIIGALNWLLVGVTNLDLVATLFGGSDTVLSRLTYILIGLGGIWTLTLLFKPRVESGNK